MIDGYVHPDFSAVAAVLDRSVSRPDRYGGAVAVFVGDEAVVDVWGGRRDPSGAPWTEDTMSISWSTTKGVTSMALHILADRGLVDYDAPVATYWPDFAAGGKERVTVRQLLTHQGGLHSLVGLIDHADDSLDWDDMVARLAAATPDPAPGSGPGYHAFTYGWLIGEIVRRVSGQSLGAFIQDEIATPLDLDGLHVGTPVDLRGRVAALMPPFQPPSPRVDALLTKVLLRLPPTKRMAQAGLAPGLMDLFRDGTLRVLDAEIGAANGTFTARSLAAMYGVLANDGVHRGVRLLSPGRSAIIGTRQTWGRDYCIPIDMHWRLGYHRAFVATRRQPRNAFGHFGLGGSGGWADPDTGLSVAYVTNDMGSPSTPFGDDRLARIGAAALASLARPRLSRTAPWRRSDPAPETGTADRVATDADSTAGEAAGTGGRTGAEPSSA